MIYPVISFVLKYRYVFLAITAAISLLGTVYYVRSLQDRIAVTQAELENNRIQQEALNNALSKKQKSNAKVKTSNHTDLVAIHRSGGWLRVD